MISRASTKAIAEAYNTCFSSYSRGSFNSTVFELHVNALYDFLYVNNFEAWFLNLAKGKYPHHKRQLLEFVLRLHTGESLVTATDGWSWKQRQSFGQRLLADLARALIAERRTNAEFAKYQPRHASVVDGMQRQLELDGYVYREGIILVPEESVLDEEEEEAFSSNCSPNSACSNERSSTTTCACLASTIAMGSGTIP